MIDKLLDRLTRVVAPPATGMTALEEMRDEINAEPTPPGHDPMARYRQAYAHLHLRDPYADCKVIRGEAD